MISFSEKVPHYLLDKHQLVYTVTFAVLFSLVFLLVSVPFSHNVWFDLATTEAFGYTVEFFAIAVLIVIISKRLMYLLRFTLDMKFGHYIIWNLAEIVAICAIYTALTNRADIKGIIDISGLSLRDIFLNSLVYCAISLGVPYIIAGMYAALNDKDNTIRLMNFSGVVTDETIPQVNEKKITLFDNNGALKLSVNSSNLYYIESNDNYIMVWYSDAGGTLKQYMLRCRLKTVEESFIDSDLVRCHRKYIVNINHVKSLSKTKDGYVLELDGGVSEPIPVTKTYESNVIARFNSR